MKTLAEAPALTDFFFAARIEVPPTLLVARNMTAAQALQGLGRTLQILSGIAAWTPEAMEPPLRDLVAQLGLRPVQLFTALRAAVTGRTVSPPLFATMAVLGRDITLGRLRQAIAALEKTPDE